VWADSGALGTHDLTGWHWWLDIPIFLDVNNGTFHVEADDDPLFVGSGFDDGQGWTIKASIHQDATGHFYSNTWELDFEQTRLNWNVEVHLEGDLEALN
jgi:hypothetical protein